jgi:hypothetical protein
MAILRWMKNLHQSTWDHNILYADISSEGEQRTLNKATFARNQKYEHGERLKVKIKILFYAEKSLTVTRRRMKFFTSKDHGNTYKLYSNHCFL